MNRFCKKIFLGCCALVSPALQAACILDMDTELGGGPPVIFQVPAQRLTLSADLPMDTSTPFATINSPLSPHLVTYINCPLGAYAGWEVINLGMVGGNNLFPTQIDGISIKIQRDNGVNRKFIPFTLQLPPELSRVNFPAGSFFIIDFFKTSETVKLTPTKVNTVLSGGNLAIAYLETKATVGLTLNVSDITINSTPVCTFDNAKSIDFNTVTPSMADSGVERPLDFEMNCKTDYGTYSVDASIIAKSRSVDGNFITVTDAGGNNDRLRIKISDSNSNAIKVDGTAKQKISSNNNVPAQFNWKATLLTLGSAAKRPTGGRFQASAEIVLQVN